MSTQTLRNGVSTTVNLQPAETLKVVAVTGSYTLRGLAGSVANTIIATAASGGTYGPYPAAVTLQLTSSALSEIDFDSGTAPVIESDTPVMVNSNPFTGRLSISAGAPVNATDLADAHIAKAVSYVGGGTAGLLDFGFRPDLVIVKAAGKPAVMFNAEQWYGNVQSFGHTTMSGSDAQPAPAINSAGVALMYNNLSAAKDSYNQSGVTYYAVGIKDNGAGFLSTFGYNGYRDQTFVAQGAASNPVDMTALAGKSPKWVHIKRDATGVGHEGVWASSDGYVKKESSAAPNSALLTFEADGTLALSTDISVNENNAGIVGEAHAVFALRENADCWGEASYSGGTGVEITFSRQVALAIILPVGAEEMIFTTRQMGKGATGGATALIDGIRLSANKLTVTGTAGNTSGVEYRVIAIYEGAAQERRDVWPSLPGVQIQSGAGRIVCGTDTSLQITGAHSMEWIGSIGDSTTEQFIFGRMNGGRATPAAGSYNFALAHTRDPDAGLEVCTSDQFSSEASDVSKQKRWRTGIVLTPFLPYHILVTHDGIDKWCMYVNGKLAKWRRLPMSVFGLPGITGTAGLTTVFGARLAGGSYFANSATVHCFGRLYNRALTDAEALQMYRRNALHQLPPTNVQTDLADIGTSLVDEWNFRNGAGTTVTATKAAANNGTITNASWVRIGG